ncbi:MAG: DNA primase [Malacoplasma sp.]
MENKSSVLKDIIKNINIVDVIKNYIDLEKKGQNYWGLCPFHGDNKPSLSVSESKNIFKCFVCNEKGNSIAFVEKFKKISFWDAFKEVCEIMNVDKKSMMAILTRNNHDDKNDKFYEMNLQATDIYNRTLFEKKYEHVLNYLINTRKLTPEILNEYKIGFSPIDHNRKYLFSIMSNEDNLFDSNRDSKLIWTPAELINSNLVGLDSNNEYVDFFVNRIIIPIRNNYGKVIGFSGRTIDKQNNVKYLNSKSSSFFKKEETLFNFDNFDKTKFDEIYLVEGYMDVFSMKILGIHNVVASMGTSISDYHISNIKKYPNIKTIILCFDNDNAGYEATSKCALKLLNSNFNVFVVKPFLKKYKDINDLLCMLPEDDSLELLKKQISYPEFEMINTFSILDDEKDTLKNTQKIIELLKSLPFNIFLVNDLTKLASYSKLDVADLKQIFNKSKLLQEDNVNDFPIKNSNSNNTYDFLFKDDQNGIDSFPFASEHSETESQEINLEKNLIELLPNCGEILDVFFNFYIGVIFFTKNHFENKLYKNILFHLKNMYRKNLETSYEKFIDYVVKHESDQHVLVKIENFIQSVVKNIDTLQITKEMQINQGLKIMKQLFDKIFFIRKAYLLKSHDFLSAINQEEKDNEIKKLITYYETNKKEITNFLDNFSLDKN